MKRTILTLAATSALLVTTIPANAAVRPHVVSAKVVVHDGGWETYSVHFSVPVNVTAAADPVVPIFATAYDGPCTHARCSYKRIVLVPMDRTFKVWGDTELSQTPGTFTIHSLQTETTKVAASITFTVK